MPTASRISRRPCRSSTECRSAPAASEGWSWLLDDERLHETIGCAIVDTAHILVIDALARGDLSTARDAAETACKAAPYDDICRLDLVKVAAAEGHEEAAEQMLTDDVFNRTDDHLPPVDLPERTARSRRQGRAGASRRRPTRLIDVLAQPLSQESLRLLDGRSGSSPVTCANAR